MKKAALTCLVVAVVIVLSFGSSGIKGSALQRSATMQGTVVDLVSGTPVPDVLINISGDGGPFVARSDEEGRFIVPDMPPGEYKVGMTREGYYWSKSRSGPSTITVTGDLRNVPYRLVKGLSVSGRILDLNGEPDSGIPVTVKRSEYRNGTRVLASVNPLSWARAGVATNRRGEYRLYGLEPGDYYLVAGFGDTLTYYPGTAEVSAAVPLKLVPGLDLAGVNMTQVRSRVFTFTVGVPQTLDSLPILGGSIRLRNPSQFQEAPGGSFRSIGGNRYSSSPIKPGEYELTWATQSPKLFGRVPFDIVDHDVDLGLIALQPGITISGRIRTSDPRIEPKGILVQLDPVSGSVGGFTGTTAADGSFSIRDVPDGAFWVAFPRLGETSRDVYMESVRYGARTPDRGDILIGKEPEGRLDIMLGIGSTVSGVVRNARGEPVPYSSVLLYPSTGSPILFKTGETDKNGAFRITGVGPGEYHGLAWEDALPSLYRDPKFLSTLNPNATLVIVRRGTPASVELRAVSVYP